MWREVIEWDPLTGTRTDYWNDGEKWGTITQQSMTHAKNIADACRELRDDDDYKRKGIKKNWMHAAIVPFWVMEKIQHEYGILRPLAQKDEVFKIVQRDFPWCMTAKGRF